VGSEKSYCHMPISADGVQPTAITSATVMSGSDPATWPKPISRELGGWDLERSDEKGRLVGRDIYGKSNDAG